MESPTGVCKSTHAVKNVISKMHVLLFFLKVIIGSI